MLLFYKITSDYESPFKIFHLSFPINPLQYFSEFYRKNINTLKSLTDTVLFPSPLTHTIMQMKLTFSRI